MLGLSAEALCSLPATVSAVALCEGWIALRRLGRRMECDQLGDSGRKLSSGDSLDAASFLV